MRTRHAPGGDPLAPTFLQRAHRRPLWFAAFRARWAGRRDGRLHALPFLRRTGPLDGGAAGLGRADGVTPAGHGPTLWLIGNAHTYEERDQLERLQAEASVAPLRVRLAWLYAEHAARCEDLQVALQRRARLADGPAPAELARRRPAEVASLPHVVADRRRREHTAERQQAEAEADRLRTAVTDLRRQIAETQAVLLSAFEAATRRSERLRWHHERRAAAYRRAHQRAWRRRTRRASQPVPDWQWPLYRSSQTLDVPQWATLPCPWIGQPLPERPDQREGTAEHPADPAHEVRAPASGE